MTPLPEAYSWLDKIESPPKLISAARAFYGLSETQGPANNPIIMGWAEELLLGKVFRDDSAQAWCGLLMAKVAKDAGKPVVLNPLWALNWATFGAPSPEPSLGDVLVFERRDGNARLIGGHVGLYVGEDGVAFHVLGGNEGDKVNIVRELKSRLYRARRPRWAISQPPSVQPHRLMASGALGASET